jgi:DHA2 family multidrug resistance protein
MRNMGASIGISAVPTLLGRDSQVHQQDLVTNLFRTNPILASRLAALAQYRRERGVCSYGATREASGRLHGAVHQQATVLSYVDTVWILAIVCLMIVPLVFIAKRPRPGQAAMGR